MRFCAPSLDDNFEMNRDLSLRAFAIPKRRAFAFFNGPKMEELVRVKARMTPKSRNISVKLVKRSKY